MLRQLIMDLKLCLVGGLILFIIIAFFLKPGFCAPAERSLEELYTKLSLISKEHESIMTTLQQIATGNTAVTKHESPQCEKSSKLTREIADTLQYLQDKLDMPKTEELLKGSGATYVRWGRKECPTINGTIKVYEGFAAGDHYKHTGGPSELLCLTNEPQWGNYDDGYLGHAFVYGAEYAHGFSEHLFGKNVLHQRVPCVVCQSVGRLAALRIPGRTGCFDSWTKEYSGYLMGGHHGHAKSTDYTCVDADPDVQEGYPESENPHWLYFVEASCTKSTIPCPPYVHGREISCVICTK